MEMITKVVRIVAPTFQSKDGPKKQGNQKPPSSPLKNYVQGS